MNRLALALRSLVSPLKVERATLASPFACGERVAVVVSCRGYGRIAGRVVSGAFDGVIFADVDSERSVVVIAGGGGLRRLRLTLPVTVIDVPTPPPAPIPSPAPTPSLPAVVLALEVP